jgi:hypothetical protein
MIISSRRLLWGLNLVLLLSASLIYRPIRSWIDQSILAKAIHPNLRVNEIRFHGDSLEPGTTLMQAVHFDWGSNLGSRTVGLSADDAWFVIENKPLADKRLVVPKAMLRGSRLYLNTNSEQKLADNGQNNTSTDASDSLWQRHLDRRFGDLNWNDLRRSLEQILLIDGFTQECNQQIQQWLSRNQQIANQAQQLAAEPMPTKNPLRNQGELEELIQALDRLFQEDQNLSKEFGQIEQKVEKKFEQISNVYERQCELVKMPASELGEPETRQKVAKELVEYAGKQVLRHFKDFAEVSDLLFRAAIVDFPEDRNQNYRASDGNVVSLENLLATGVFRSDHTRAPFHIRTRYQASLPLPGKSKFDARFRYQFETPRYTVRVQSSTLAEQQDVIDLKLAVTLLPATQTQWLDSQSDRELSGAQWILRCQSDQIKGTVLLDQVLLPFLGEGDPKLAAAVASALEKAEKSGMSIEPIQLNLTGNWEQPRCTVVTPFMPTWIVDIVGEKLKHQQQQEQREKVARLEKFFSDELERLYGGLNQVLEQAKQQTQRNSRQMLAVRSQLQQSLSEVQNVEFARTKSQDVSR